MKIKSRLVRLEVVMAPPSCKRRQITTFAGLCDGNETQQTTEKETIDRHLAAHPEDAGMEFDVIIMSWVHGRWNKNGELVCETPDCPNFGKVIKRPSVAA